MTAKTIVKTLVISFLVIEIGTIFLFKKSVDKLNNNEPPMPNNQPPNWVNNDFPAGTFDIPDTFNNN